MHIVTANTLQLSTARITCVDCGNRIAPIGTREPYLTNQNGDVYCRDCGSAQSGKYEAILNIYRAMQDGLTHKKAQGKISDQEIQDCYDVWDTFFPKKV